MNHLLFYQKNTNSYHLSNLGAMLTCRCSIEMQKHLGKSSNGFIMVYEHLIKPKRIKSSSITLYTTKFCWAHVFKSDFHLQLITWITCWLESNKCKQNMWKIQGGKISHFDYTSTIEFDSISSCLIFPRVFSYLRGIKKIHNVNVSNT